LNNNKEDAGTIGGVGAGVILILTALGLRVSESIARNTEIILIVFGAGSFLVGISVHLSRLKWHDAARGAFLIGLVLLIVGVILSYFAWKQ